MAFDFDPKALPKWLQRPTLPPAPSAPSLPPLPWLAYLPWFRRDENEQDEAGERPALGQRIGMTLGQRIAGMHAAPATPVSNAAPTKASVPFDPSMIPASIQPQPDEREDAASLPSLPSLPSLRSLPTLPSLPSLSSLPWLTRTANIQREKPKESTEDMDE